MGLKKFGTEDVIFKNIIARHAYDLWVSHFESARKTMSDLEAEEVATEVVSTTSYMPRRWDYGRCFRSRKLREANSTG